MKRRVDLPDNEKPAKRLKRLQQIAQLPPRMVIGIPVSAVYHEWRLDKFTFGWAFENEQSFVPFIRLTSPTRTAYGDPGGHEIHTLQDWEALLDDSDTKQLEQGRRQRADAIQVFLCERGLATLVQDYAPFEESCKFWIRWHLPPHASALSRPVLSEQKTYIDAVGFHSPPPQEWTGDEANIECQNERKRLGKEDDGMDEFDFSHVLWKYNGYYNCFNSGCSYEAVWLDSFPSYQLGLTETSARYVDAAARGLYD